MKKKGFFGICAAALCVVATAFSGCGSSMFNFNGYSYPDYPKASPDDTIDSWTQWEKDEIVSIDWFIDSTSYSLPQEESVVVKKILEKTGVKIKFRKALSGDGTELTTMVAGNQLPDLVSVTSGMYDLIKEKSIFPINGLAERWAPSLMRRIKAEGEMYTTYKDANDDLYFIVNNFYNSKEIEEYREIGGNILPNDGVVVRKDYLDAFCAYKKSKDASWTDDKIANPAGMLEFLKWTKENFNLSNANHSVLLSPFDSGEEFGSRGIQVLMEYFGCSKEDENGNFAYAQADGNFTEMMQWLNELYRNNLLTEGCLGATQTQVNQYIQTGEPIMYMGKMITPSSAFRNWELNISGKNPQKQSAAYVPVVFGNAAGEVPQISYRTSGELFTMVSANCKRPDRVIKLLDYLYSEEGQRLVYYGIDQAENQEKGTYFYATQPGESVTLENGKTHVYKYGRLDYTKEVKDAFLVNVESYGIYFCMFLCNPMYVPLTSVDGGQFNNYRDYVKWNSRAALIPYSYDKRGFEFVLDSSDSRYKKGLNVQSNLRSKWYKKYAEIIGKSSAESVKEEIETLLKWCKSAGLDDYIAYSNDCFKKHKERLGIRYAWAPNDETSASHALKITSVYGDRSYYKTAPAHMEVQS